MIVFCRLVVTIALTVVEVGVVTLMITPQLQIVLVFPLQVNLRGYLAAALLVEVGVVPVAVVPVVVEAAPAVVPAVVEAVVVVAVIKNGLTESLDQII